MINLYYTYHHGHCVVLFSNNDLKRIIDVYHTVLTILFDYNDSKRIINRAMTYRTNCSALTIVSDDQKKTKQKKNGKRRLLLLLLRESG